MRNSNITRKRAVLGLGVALALLPAMTGCSAAKDAVSGAAGLPTASTLKSGTEKVLEEQNIEIAGDLTCTVDMGGGTITKKVTGDCTGVDTDDNAVTSTLADGEYSDARDRCTATLVVSSAGEVISEVTGFDCAS